MPDRPALRRKSRATTITLTDELHAHLRLIADRRLGSVSQIVREACQEYAQREKREEAQADAR